jgi:hypothetical protein
MSPPHEHRACKIDQITDLLIEHLEAASDRDLYFVTIRKRMLEQILLAKV